MFSFLARLGISAAALYFIANISGGSIVLHTVSAALIAALVLGIVNAIIKPVLLFIAELLTLPLSCITLGLWSLVLSFLMNGLMFYVVGGAVPGFQVKTFWAALWGALALSIVNAITSALIGGHKREARRR